MVVQPVTALAGLIAGAFLALVFVRLVRAFPAASETRIYTVGLVCTALVYVAFAIVGRSTGRWLAIEGVGVVVYGVAALLGLRYQVTLLSIAWAAHVAWDVLLHLNGSGADYTPQWYPWSCVSFDLIVAFVVLASRKGINQN